MSTGTKRTYQVTERVKIFFGKYLNHCKNYLELCQDLCCLQIQLFFSLVLKELTNCHEDVSQQDKGTNPKHASSGTKSVHGPLQFVEDRMTMKCFKSNLSCLNFLFRVKQTI